MIRLKERTSIMKIASIMNFARQVDQRMEDSENILFNATSAELDP